MSTLGRRLEDLLPDARRFAGVPILCECGRLNPRHRIKPKGQPERYACGWCAEAERRADPAEFRPGHDPAEILP